MKNIRGWKKFLNEGQTEASKGKRTLTRQFFDAIENYDIEKCRELLALGVSVNAKISSRNWQGSALHLATSLKQMQQMKFLLDNGADPNIKNSRKGETPLHLVTGPHYYTPRKADWYVEAAKLLIARGANPNEQDLYGISPLSNQCTWNKMSPSDSDLEMIDLLIDNGAEIDQEDNAGETALEKSLTYEYTNRQGRVLDTKVAKKLIERGANPFKAFKSLQELIDYFGGDLGWVPDGPAKNAIRRAERSYDLFGED